MRILVLTTDAFGGHGGIAKYNRDLLTALCSFPGCKEVVAFPRVMPFEPEALPAKLTYVTRGLGGKPRYVLAVIAEVLRNRKYDLIICGHINLLPLAVIVKLWVRSPLLVLLYGIDVWQSHKSNLTNWAIKWVDCFVSISEFTKEKFLAWANLPEENVPLLPNAITISDYGTKPKSEALLYRYGLSGKTVLMTLGRLSADERYKGIDEVLEILPELIQRNSQLMYLVVGDGSDRHRLEEKAAALGIRHHVVFTGLIPESEKADHYRLADVFVMPGYGEGFGFVYLEAMACGVPAVASKLDGSREAVRNGELGVIVDPSSRNELMAGILEALERPRGKIPEGLDYFSYSNFEKQLHGIIRQVVPVTEQQR